jgi:hypothetical protein
MLNLKLLLRFNETGGDSFIEKKKNLNPKLRRGVKVCPFAAKHIGEASGKWEETSGWVKGEAARTVVLLGERDDALHPRCALEYGDCLLGGGGDDVRPGGGGDEAERVERAGRGGRSGEDGGGWRGCGQEEGLRGHGPGGGDHGEEGLVVLAAGSLEGRTAGRW